MRRYLLVAVAASAVLVGCGPAWAQRISDLPAASVGNAGDLIGCTQGYSGPGTGVSRKCTAAQLAGGAQTITTVTNSYTTLAADVVICVNDATTNPTITLGSGFTAGTLQTVTDCGLHASAHNITVAPTSGTISGFANALFNVDGTSQAFRYTGTTWVMQ